jgi:hypothetical protein
MIATTEDSSSSPGLVGSGADVRWRALLARLTDLLIVGIAIAGLWFFWSQYSYLSGLSWWYDNTQHIRERTAGRQPDYDLGSLPWQVAHPRLFDVKPGRITLVTSDEPFGYQAFAAIETAGARAVDLLFEVDVESGGVTIGLLQGGKFIATSSTRQAGSFVDGNSAQLTYRRSMTVVIANNNPAGESRLTIKSLRVFLRK